MLFNSTTFGLFFCVVFVVAWALRSSLGLRNAFLLGASWWFYGQWSWRFLGLILFSTVLDYSIGLVLDRHRDPVAHRRVRHLAITASLLGNLGVLAFFKYWNFFAGEAVDLLTALGLETGPIFTDVILPVGISFYTFQTLSYTIDLYRGQIEVERSLPRFALFVAFFPQLVAGPIVRARDFLPQLRQPPRLSQGELEAGLTQIFQGLLKKVAIADVLGRSLVDPFWADPSAAGGGWLSLLAIYGYAFQIYGDFSGYSDIAIGAARLLGFDLGVNFRSPYRSASFKELWTRWHISLSSWLRDYLYVPLGGNRKGSARTSINLQLTMLLGGLWHGASWMFVAWGAWHGAMLATERRLGLHAHAAGPTLWLRRFVVFHLVCLGWVLFRSVDLAAATAVLGSLVSAPSSGAIAQLGWLPLVVLAVAAVTHLAPDAWTERVRAGFTSLPTLVQGAAYGGVLLLLAAVQRGETPFIYFQF